MLANGELQNLPAAISRVSHDMSSSYEQEDSDTTLIIREQRGDKLAQEAIVEAYAPMVFRLIGRFFRNREDVEDLAQDVFVKALKHIHRLEPERNVKGWLVRITINTFYDQLRKNQRRKTAMETYRPDTYTARFRSEPSPEFDDVVQSAFASLNEKFRIPLVLREIEGMTIDEIAESMGLTRTNVKVRLFRARLKLKRLIGTLVHSHKSASLP